MRSLKCLSLNDAQALMIPFAAISRRQEQTQAGPNAAFLELMRLAATEISRAR